MNIVLLHDAVGEGSSPDELDVYAQMDAIEPALRELRHTFSRIPLALNLEAGAAALRERRPDLVFNLSESMGGSGRLIHFAPALLETLGIPYTGCPADAVYCTSNKLIAKRILRSVGIPTPVSYSLAELRRGVEIVPGRYILKSVWEHASRGLDEDSVVRAGTSGVLLEALESKLPALADEGFAEQYIDGREFNLSVLCGAILPQAEIVFEGYERSKPKVVGYRAKWDEGSYEFHHTPRRYEFPHADKPLLIALDTLAMECWKVFGLRGYARVDFRVDEENRPYVLEVNTNPCLSPDAGFAAAVARAEITFTESVRRIVNDAVPDGTP
jgi:D-alanine-D-alanine ligase